MSARNGATPNSAATEIEGRNVAVAGECDERSSKPPSSHAQQFSDTGWADWPPEPEALLRAIRSAVLRCKLDENELVTIGTALKAGMVTPADAVEWLQDIGLVGQVIPDEVQP